METRKGNCTGSLALIEEVARQAPGIKGRPAAKQAKRGRPVGAKPRSLVLPESAERVLVTVEDAARRLSIGRATCYKLVMRGAIRSIQIGRLRRIPVEALEEFAARQMSA